MQSCPPPPVTHGPALRPSPRSTPRRVQERPRKGRPPRGEAPSTSPTFASAVWTTRRQTRGGYRLTIGNSCASCPNQCTCRTPVVYGWLGAETRCDVCALPRLGQRMLARIGVRRENITFLTNGSCWWAPKDGCRLRAPSTRFSQPKFRPCLLPLLLPALLFLQVSRPASTLIAVARWTSCCWTFACPCALVWR